MSCSIAAWTSIGMISTQAAFDVRLYLDIPGDALLDIQPVLDDPDFSCIKALQTAQQNFVVTDPSLPDNPIVYASQGFNGFPPLAQYFI